MNKRAINEALLGVIQGVIMSVLIFAAMFAIGHISSALGI